MVSKAVIIILNWNGLTVSVPCIQSVKQTRYTNFDILLVDNGSTDGSYDVLKETFPDIRFLHNPENLGFAEGNNRGIKLAFNDLAADYVVLLNNDTIVDSGWLQSLVDVAVTHPEVGAVGSKIYYYDKPETIWCTGGSFGGWRGVPDQLRHNEVDVRHIEEPYQVDYASGCSILITRKAFEGVGYLDADYFLYFEETDWCARARREGYKIMIAPQSYVWHKVGFSSGTVDSPLHTYYMARNNYAFIFKNTFGMIRYLRLFILLCVMIRRYILGKIGRDNYQPTFRAVLLGIQDAIRGKLGRASDSLQVFKP